MIVVERDHHSTEHMVYCVHFWEKSRFARLTCRLFLLDVLGGREVHLTALQTHYC